MIIIGLGLLAAYVYAGVKGDEVTTIKVVAVTVAIKVIGVLAYLTDNYVRHIDWGKTLAYLVGIAVVYAACYGIGVVIRKVIDRNRKPHVPERVWWQDVISEPKSAPKSPWAKS